MLSILSDTQKAVVDTITMKLDLVNALDYLKNVGFPMKRRTYYRHKKKIEDMKLERMRFIARVAYEEQHLDRVDRMELIESQMWINYWKEEDRYKKVKILAEIVSIQPYISSYYEATKGLVEAQQSKVNQNLILNLNLPKKYQTSAGTDQVTLYYHFTRAN